MIAPHRLHSGEVGSEVSRDPEGRRHRLVRPVGGLETPRRAPANSKSSASSPLERILMNFSDGSPDKSPSSSPPLTLPPPKAKRQPAARPRKPRPSKEVVLKIKPPAANRPLLPQAVTKPVVAITKPSITSAVPKRPVPAAAVPRAAPYGWAPAIPPIASAVTKPRSAPTAQPRKRVPSREKLVPENSYVEEEPILERPPPFGKPRVSKPHIPKVKLQPERRFAEEAVPEKRVVEKPPPPPPRAPKPKKVVLERPPLAEAAAPVQRLVVPHNPYLEGPRIEKPHGQRAPRVKKERPPKAAAPPAVAPRPPQSLKRKAAPDPPESTDSDHDVHQVSRGQQEKVARSHQERQRALETATRQLESIVEATTVMVEELQNELDAKEDLESEKLKLLDELLVWEGLTDNPYAPLTIPVPPKKAKRVRK